MSVVSGEVPYTYIDLPFTFQGRGAGSVGVPWQDQGTPIPEPSGYLLEQAMFVHLAEMRKYAEPDLETHYFWNYKAGVVAGATKEPIYDPDPSGANISPSGNTNCLNFIQDLRNSFDRICQAIATDSLYTSGQIKRDYFQATFSGLPSGQAGDYQYRIWDKPLFFGPINSSGLYYVGASGYVDSQTLKEISYQPYARFSRRGTKELSNVLYETAPLFPAVIGSDGSFPTIGADETIFYDGDYGELGAPQASGYNVYGVASGYLRVCGDALSLQSRLYPVSGDHAPFFVSDVSKRWIGKAEDRNRSEASYLLETNGLAYVVTASQNLPYGVHKAIIVTPPNGHGATSGAISVYPSDSFYDTTGWIDGLIGTDAGNDIVRNKTGGVPDDGVTTQPSGGNVVNRSLGLHICDHLLGARNTRGFVNTSPFNGASLYINAVSQDNFGGTGAAISAYFTRQPPPGLTWVWRRSYSPDPVYWSSASHLIQPENEDVAYGFVGTQWIYRSFSYTGTGTPDPWIWSIGSVGLGQTEAYHFMKMDMSTRTAERVLTSYNHISHNRSYSMNGIAWSRNYGWYAIGGVSTDNHKFETCRITGSPDGGTVIASNAGSLSILSPIGIGDYSFVRRTIDVTGGNRLYWTIQLGNSEGYNSVLLNAYDVVATTGVPFVTADITPTFIGHTIFIGSNDEGITEGDWVVVDTSKGRFLCRAEVDTAAYEIQLVECLFGVIGSSETPEVFHSI